MNNSIKFRISEKYEDAEAVYQALCRYDMSRTGEKSMNPHAECHGEQMTILASDDSGAFHGGLVFYWLNDPRRIFINYFFLDETVRGQGFGRKIFDELTSLAQQHGATRLEVRSNTFQAPGFYLKMGFEVAGEKKEPHPLCPENIHYSFRKELKKA